jgi:hypothetical protein
MKISRMKFEERAGSLWAASWAAGCAAGSATVAATALRTGFEEFMIPFLYLKTN